MGTDKILERKPHVTHLFKTPTTTHNNTQHDTFGQVGSATKFCKVENMFFSSKKIKFFIGNLGVEGPNKLFLKGGKQILKPKKRRQFFHNWV
jgi:hypothetical protein